MRALLIRRQSVGEIAEHVDDLARELAAQGIQAIVEDAGDWMPNSTKGSEAKESVRRLRDLGKNADVVHAFGMRAAWACAESWGANEAWMYSAYDMPRALPSELVTRLMDASRGFGSSYAVTRMLESAGAPNVEALWMGCRAPDPSPRSKEQIREMFGLSSSDLVVGAAPPVPHRNSTPNDWGQDALLQAWHDVQVHFPDAKLAIFASPNAEVEEMLPSGIVRKDVAAYTDAMTCCDLWVEAGKGVGFSRRVCQAMALGVPVLVRSDGGLPEQIAEHVSGFLFWNDDTLASSITEALELDLTRQAIGQAGTVRFQEMFTARRCADRVADVYRDLLLT